VRLWKGIHHMAALGADTLLDKLPFATAVITPGRRVLFLNRAMEALTGFSRDEALGLRCDCVLRCSVCLDDCPLAAAGNQDKPLSLEGDVINRDRRRLPVRLSLSAVPDDTGAPAFYLETLEERPGGIRPALEGGPMSFSRIIGRSPAMERLFETLPAVAQTDSSLLITGETGTGKDVLAEAIHQASPRSKGPFIKVNCGALPESLLESELFGHRKGAFTGAVKDKPGRIQLAEGGTLFLTEVGDLPLPLQVKLLSFLDDRVVYPLGGTSGVVTNVRLIAATHHDLEAAVAAGRFRQDLMFRLNVIRLHLPPLRDRGVDVRLLLDHFLNVCSAQLGKNVLGLDERALATLMGHPYPGNVRELRNIVEYACTMCRGEQITASDLPAYLKSQAPAPDEARAAEPEQPQHGAPQADYAELERGRMLKALLEAGGRKGKAAQALGLSRTTFWRKLKSHGIAGEEKP
jgi:Response regulator containing CheY-like receiver, AAA-type ATPase, and DNA-binding domains